MSSVSKRAADVVIEGLPGPGRDGGWPALVAADTWNGWAIPWFDAETAAAIVATLDAQDGTQATKDADKVTVITEGSEFPEEVFTAETIDGKPWYPIGAYAWCWMPAEAPSRPASLS